MPIVKHLLDRPATYSRYDKAQLYDSLILFRDQIKQAWVEVSYTPLNEDYKKAENIIVAGMGGSALGGHIIRSLDQAILKVPMEIVSNYRLPAFVNSKSLVVVNSYSGNTEEMLSCLRDALGRKAKIFVIATGGKLADLARRHKLGSYIFEPLANPVGQPRMGFGYSVTALLAFLSRTGFLHIKDSEVEEIIDGMQRMTAMMERTVSIKKNPAKDLAAKLVGKMVMIVAANHLSGAAHTIRNHIHENAKTLAVQFDLPELNHHLLEAMAHPEKIKQLTHVVMINSAAYPQIIQARLNLSRAIFKRLGYEVTVIKPESSNPLMQVFEALYFGSFLGYYLSMANRLDPSPIVWVDYFKKELENYWRKV